LVAKLKVHENSVNWKNQMRSADPAFWAQEGEQLAQTLVNAQRLVR
jgi:hypothetical protein